MEYHRAPGDRVGHGVGIEYVAVPHLDRTALECVQATGRAGQDPNAVAFTDEEASDIGADETGGAGNQNI
jgi:hypothetical protein